MRTIEELTRKYNAIKAEVSQKPVEDRAKIAKEKMDKEFSLDEMMFIAKHCIRHI